MTYDVPATVGLFLLAFITTAVLTRLLTNVALQKGMLDIPNGRSSHETPVPRGGGLSIVAVFLCFVASALAIASPGGYQAPLSWLLLGGFAVAAIGFIDDLKNIPQIRRLAVHLAAVAYGFIVLPSLPSLDVMGYVLEPGWIGTLLLLLGLAWFINVFNFMDGIDGIAAVQAITMLANAAIIVYLLAGGTWLVMFGLLVACIGGFLLWNWPPAKVFMGDACSGFLGFILGALAVITSVYGPLNLWVWLILGGVFLVDATVTLLIRRMRGVRWYRPHRNHAYQKLSRRLNSHAKVTLFVLFINVIWLGPLALAAAKSPSTGVLLCAMAWAPILLIVIWAGAGRPEAPRLTSLFNNT